MKLISKNNKIGVHKIKDLRLLVTMTLAMVPGVPLLAAAETGGVYASMLEALRTEISAKLPQIDDATRKSIVEAKDAKARVAAVRKLAALDPFLAANGLDAKLAKLFILQDATPAGLAEFAGQGSAQKQLIDGLLADNALMLQIAIADGARPVHGKDLKSPAGYGKALEIYTAIQKASPKAKKGVLQRLALAVALEFNGLAQQPKDDETPDAFRAIDPVKRYLHFEKAFEASELDPAFELLGV